MTNPTTNQNLKLKIESLNYAISIQPDPQIKERLIALNEVNIEIFNKKYPSNDSYGQY
jgi:hypothetical protein